MKIPMIARRAGWNLVDQAISSVTNAALSILVARSVDDAAFGGFAVAFTIFTLLIGVSRAIATSPLGIRFSDASPEDFKDATAAATGAGLALSVVTGAGCVAVGIWMGGPVGPALVALGVVFPGLIVQENWRQVFFAAGRPAAATLNDTAWAVVQFAAIFVLLETGSPTVVALIIAWGGAAVAAGLLGVRQARVWPRPGRTIGWLREHRDLTGYMGLEFATLQGTNQTTLLIIAAIGSLEAIGALRGVQVLLGPATVVATAALSFAIPEFARRRRRLSERQWALAALAVAGCVALLGLLWGLAFVLIPDSLGVQLLGDTWTGARDILWATIVAQAGAAASLGPGAMLYAMGRAKVTLGIHSLFAVLVFSGGVGGVLLAGAPGAAWGFAVAFWATVPLWWSRMRREARVTAASREPGGTDLGDAGTARSGHHSEAFTSSTESTQERLP
jgi:O-antigen/teichoic acid export membrane protein